MAYFCPNCFQLLDQAQGFCGFCGYRKAGNREKRALPEGEWLHNRYLIGRVLGVGGFGITYLAYDNTRRSRCAVKEYFPVEWSARSFQSKSIEPHEETKAFYENGMHLFLEEANLIQNLRSEKAVVDVFDFFETNGTTYMVMEYIEGVTLSNYMRDTEAPLPLDEASRMLQCIAEALYGIHNAMLLHRDISPDNIIRKYNGEFKLIDFGSTRAYALDVPNSFSVLVKAGFAPIEQYSKTGEQGPWTDIYSLAATYYYVLSGKKIPSAPDRELGEQVVPLRQYVPRLAIPIERAIMRALDVDWRKRQRSMKEFLQNLNFDFDVSTMRLLEEPRTLPGVRQTEGGAVPRTQSQKGLTTYLVLQLSDQPNWRKEWQFFQGKLQIGRNMQGNDICLNDRQISGNHCVVWYHAQEKEFYVTNYSRNGTYMSVGRLESGQSARLHRNEWFYLQTRERRYIFYLEVK